MVDDVEPDPVEVVTSRSSSVNCSSSRPSRGTSWSPAHEHVLVVVRRHE
jgi:hypothetical protein